MRIVRVVLCKGTGWMSKGIEWQTRGDYSHAAIMFEDDILIESMQFEGVRVRVGLPKDVKCDVFPIQVTEEQYLKIQQFAKAQLGKGYDYTMVIRFLTRKKASNESTNSWFCSELVFACFIAAGIELFKRTKAWEVNPSMLPKSPLL